MSLNGCVTKHRVPEFIRVASVGDSANDHVIQSADGAPQSESSPYCEELDNRTGEMLQRVAKAIVSISRPKFDGIMRIKLQDIPRLGFLHMSLRLFHMSRLETIFGGHRHRRAPTPPVRPCLRQAQGID